MFGLYKGRHQILYLASCGCLNMLKSFQKLEGEDDEEDDVPETIEMVVEGGNQQNDVNGSGQNAEQRPKIKSFIEAAHD